MKNQHRLLPLLALALVMGLPTGLRAEVNFLSISLKEALGKAQQENKLVFVDVYASWCGPCKKLDNKVFSREDVGKVMNAHFLPLKIDGESEAGQSFRETYGLDAYPSLYVINAQGELAYKSVGYRPPEQLLALLERVQTPANRLTNLRPRYESSAQPSAELLRNYYRALQDANMNDEAEEVYEAFMKTLEKDEWLKPANAELVFSRLASTEDSKFTYLVQHREAFLEHNDADQYRQLVMQAAKSDLSSIVKNEDKESLLDLQQRLREAFPDEHGYLADYVKLIYAKHLGDIAHYREAADQVVNEGLDDPVILNEIAWYYYQKVDDREALDRALGWIEQAIELERRYAFLDTRAALLFKLGQTKAGRRAADEALEQAKQEGADWSGTFDLIEKWTQ